MRCKAGSRAAATACEIKHRWKACHDANAYHTGYEACIGLAAQKKITLSWERPLQGSTPPGAPSSGTSPVDGEHALHARQQRRQARLRAQPGVQDLALAVLAQHGPRQAAAVAARAQRVPAAVPPLQLVRLAQQALHTHRPMLVMTDECGGSTACSAGPHRFGGSAGHAQRVRAGGIGPHSWLATRSRPCRHTLGQVPKPMRPTSRVYSDSRHNRLDDHDKHATGLMHGQMCSSSF